MIEFLETKIENNIVPPPVSGLLGRFIERKSWKVGSG